MDELIQLITKTYGLVGLLILAPMGGLVIVYRDYRRAQAERDRAEREWAERLRKCEQECGERLSVVNDKVIGAQLQRVADAQAVTSKLVELVSDQSALNRETNLALESIGNTLTVLRVGRTRS